MYNGCHAHTYPYCERIERACVCVVTLTWLHWVLVQVEYDCKSCHEEQHAHDEALSLALLAVLELPYDTEYAQYQRQCEEYVASLVLLEHCWEFVEVAQTKLVKELYSCYPIAVLGLSVTLHVILASHEVPEEVSPVHVVQLVVHEECEVIQLRRHCDPALAVLRRNGVLYASCPVLVILLVSRTPHAWEQHVLCEYILRVVLQNLVLAVVAYVYGAGLHLYGLAVLVALHLGVETLSVEERACTVLLTVQVYAKREDVLG